MFRDDRLMCRVANLSYSFSAHLGEIWLAPGDCCDMKGCIALFEAIDPDVKSITTYSGTERDTVYDKNSEKWIAWIRVPEKV